jgi:hypothetical protein
MPSGRGNIGKQSLQILPILDVTKLSSNQINEAVKIFDDMNNQEMLPIHEINKDPVRKKRDELFARKVLVLPKSILVEGGPLDILRMKLSQEPSIRGSK